MSAPLHIQLLGDFRLSAGAAPLTTVAAPRLQALLAYLLLHHAAPQPRRLVAFLLWPDSGEPQALTNLRSLLLLLRRALPDADRLLRADRTTLHWAPAVPWHCDVVDFERALAAVHRARAAGNDGARRAALEAAVTCYYGELLPGCYDEWLLPVRDRLQLAYLAALEQLVPLLETAGDVTAALATAHRLVTVDPLHEDGYGHLMRLQARLGDLTAVRRTFRACTTMLQRELGTEPSPATRATFEQLLQPAVPPAAFLTLPVYLEPILGRDTTITCSAPGELARWRRPPRPSNCTGASI